MRDLRGSYVYRGDLRRRRERVKRTVLGVACCTAALVVYENQRVDEARAALSASERAGEVAPALGAAPTVARSEVALANDQLEQWNRIFGFSTQFNVRAQLAKAIHDIAIAEGIEPELAFRLVRVESGFKERATSPVGAVGLAQVMPGTAKYFEKGITRGRGPRRRGRGCRRAAPGARRHRTRG